MWSTVWFSFTFFELYAYFMIYSFLGWAMESTYVSINAKKWVNRGFINGPFCPIYGTGALLILLALKPVSDSILLLFLGGFVIATVVEYLIGLILEKLFHATWWDYSQKPFNIKGRVCLERSVEWGVLTAFVMRVVQPVIADFVAAIPRAWGEFAATLLLAYPGCGYHDYGAAYPAVQRKAGIPQRSERCAAEKARGNEALCFPTGNHYAFREHACCGISA